MSGQLQPHLKRLSLETMQAGFATAQTDPSRTSSALDFFTEVFPDTAFGQQAASETFASAPFTAPQLSSSASSLDTSEHHLQLQAKPSDCATEPSNKPADGMDATGVASIGVEDDVMEA